MRARLDHRQNGGEMIGLFLRCGFRLAGAIDIRMLHVAHEHRGHLLRGQDKIDLTGGDGAGGHIVVGGGGRLLHHGHAALLFDGPQT